MNLAMVGDDDLKHHDDDKDSDAEDVSSPTSQEHSPTSQERTDNHHQEEEEKIKLQGSSEENKSSGEQREDDEATQAENEEDRDIEIEQELEPDDDELRRQSTATEDFEPKKDTKGGVLPQSLDESSVVQNETESKLNRDDLNSKTATFENVELLKEAKDEISMQSMKGDEGGVSQIEADLKTMDGTESKNVTVEPTTTLLKESTDGDLSRSQNDESHIIDKKIVSVDNAQFGKSIQEINSISECLTELTNSMAVHHSSSVEPKYMDEVEKLKLCQEKTSGDISASADSNGEMKENGASLQERNGKMPPNCVDSGSDNQGIEAIVKKHAAAEVGDKLSVSCNVTVTETANGADSSNSPNLVEHLKDSEDPKSSDCQVVMCFFYRMLNNYFIFLFGNVNILFLLFNTNYIFSLCTCPAFDCFSSTSCAKNFMDELLWAI